MANLQATFIALDVICFVLNILPGLFHIRMRNIPAIAIVCYLQIQLINGFVNVIIWGGSNYFNSWNGKGWCDLIIRLQAGTTVGLASSAFCILLKLFFIFLANDVTVFWFDNKYAQPVTEVFFSFGFPLLVAIFSYFAMPTRYQIFKYTGCVATYAGYTISLLVYYFWIFFFSFMCLILSVATLMIFYMKRKAAKDILLCTNSRLSFKRFARLLIFCIIVTILSIVLSSLLAYTIRGMQPTFYDKKVMQNEFWGLIFFFKHDNAQDYTRWIIIVLSFTNFVIFGFGSDATEMYCDIIKKLPCGERFLQWVSHKLSYSKEKTRYFGMFVPKGEKRKELPTDVGDAHSSPAETYFTFADSKRSHFPVYEDDIEMDLDPAVRSQLLEAEMGLGKNDNLEEFEYLYYN